MEKVRLFIDMDGTLAEFKKIDTLEQLYEEHYFLSLKPLENVVQAVKILIKEHPELEVYILSAFLTDSAFALQEKNKWLDTYLPEVDKAHRIFTPCGQDKKNYIDIREQDVLLDDYTHNLSLWQPPARGIKLLNGINHTKRTWKGACIQYDKEAEELVKDILAATESNVMAQEANQSVQRAIRKAFYKRSQIYEEEMEKEREAPYE